MSTKTKEVRVIVTVAWDSCLSNGELYGKVTLRHETVRAMLRGRQEYNAVFIVSVPSTEKTERVSEVLQSNDLGFAFINQEAKTVAGVFGPDVECIMLYWDAVQDINLSVLKAAGTKVDSWCGNTKDMVASTSACCDNFVKQLGQFDARSLDKESEHRLTEQLAYLYMHLYGVGERLGLNEVLERELFQMSMKTIMSCLATEEGE